MTGGRSTQAHRLVAGRERKVMAPAGRWCPQTRFPPRRPPKILFSHFPWGESESPAQRKQASGVRCFSRRGPVTQVAHTPTWSQTRLTTRPQAPSYWVGADDRPQAGRYRDSWVECGPDRHSLLTNCRGPGSRRAGHSPPVQLPDRDQGVECMAHDRLGQGHPHAGGGQVPTGAAVGARWTRPQALLALQPPPRPSATVTSF